jgi:hypothetical protein
MTVQPGETCNVCSVIVGQTDRAYFACNAEPAVMFHRSGIVSAALRVRRRRITRIDQHIRYPARGQFD